MNTYTITYSVGTSRHDEQRFVKTVKAAGLSQAVSHAYAIESRAKTTVVSIKLTSEVYA